MRRRTASVLVQLFLFVLVHAEDRDGDGSDDADEKQFTCQEYTREMQQCIAAAMDVEDLDAYYEILNPFRVPAEDFQGWCDSVGRLQTCAEHILEAAGEDRVDDCNYMQDTLMMVHTAGYSCGEGKDVLTSHYQCFEERISVSNSVVLEECMGTAMAKMHGDNKEEAAYHDHDEDGLEGPEKCTYQSLFADCVAEEAEKACGREAGKFIVGMKHYLKPKLWVAWNCDEDEKNGASVRYGGLTLAILFFFASVKCLMF